MNFDHCKLIGKIKEKYNNRNEFCQLISISNNSLTKKLKNEVSFTSKEIYKIIDVLDIDKKEISNYFFTPKVEKVQQK